MSALAGRAFLKMSGSGNDFIFLDVRTDPLAADLDAAAIRRLCARGTGVGADGIVLIDAADRAPFAMRYYNADGSLAALCGNATLCAARFAVESGIVTRAAAGEGFEFLAGTGRISARMVGDRPEIDLVPPRSLAESLGSDPAPADDEDRLGFVEIGVPHVVVLCDDAESAAVEVRGATLRRHPAFPQGANVNFLSGSGDSWRYRTYERGVEAETLACGTGAAACAVLLSAWGKTGRRVELQTSSGSLHEVTIGAGPTDPVRLKGEARIVYRGVLEET